MASKKTLLAAWEEKLAKLRDANEAAEAQWLAINVEFQEQERAVEAQAQRMRLVTAKRDSACDALRAQREELALIEGTIERLHDLQDY